MTGLIAIVAAAGSGSRMYPITRVIDKPMLPLGNYPTIHYVVREAIDCNVDAIVIVKPSGRNQISEYFALSDVRRELRRSAGRAVPPIEMLEQDPGSAYGTAAPLLTVASARALGDVDVLYMSADDVLLHRGSTKAPDCPNGPVSVGAVWRDASQAQQYGMLEVDGERVTALVEKPEAPAGNQKVLINCSRYVFRGRRMLEVLLGMRPDTRSGELRITDGIQHIIGAGDRVSYDVLDADYLDVGTPRAYLNAANHMLHCMSRDPN